MQTMKVNTAHHLDPVLFAKDALGFKSDDWQADVLRSFAEKIILNCCRQSGKSTVAAIICLHRALFFPSSLVLLVSPSQRQSSEGFKKIISELNKLDQQPKRLEDNRLSIQLENGSRIVSLPSSEATVRGFSNPSLIVVDEASRVLDQLYYAIRPMLAVSSGRLILLSTPFGKRGFFHKEWTDGKGWKKVLMTAENCPRITGKFLQQELASVGQWFYDQEYFCKFKESVDSVFSYDDVINAVDDEIEVWEFGGSNGKS